MEITERNYLNFNGVDLRNYGLYVSGDKTFDSPQKEITKVSIPGRSGDLIRFNGRYQNVTLEYSSILIEDFDTNVEALREILMTPMDYVRLEDGYHPDEYRMAFFQGPLNFDVLYLEAGSTTLQFDCKPQRWLKSGEVPIDNLIGSLGRLIANETGYPAYPLFAMNGYGNPINITFPELGDSKTLTLKVDQADAGEYFIDCESMNCYKYVNGVKTNVNSYLTVTDFPTLVPGPNRVKITGETANISSIYMIPRWYIL